jgi:hypothetical protein
MMCPGSRLRIETRIVCAAPVDSANVGITIYDAGGYRLVDANTAMQGRFVSMQPGDEARVEFTLDDVRLKPGTYLVGLWMGAGTSKTSTAFSTLRRSRSSPTRSSFSIRSSSPARTCAPSGTVSSSRSAATIESPNVLADGAARRGRYLPLGGEARCEFHPSCAASFTRNR